MTLFKGEGFSRAPLTDEEAAQFREMAREVTEAWPYLMPIVGLAKAAKTLAAIFVVSAVIGGALAWAAKMGVF
jgi:hypothetical protein